ncbi:MAG: lipopolysaccharide biosynthesis protein [Kiloniellales bacterium]|nr:lipopolysaccharide biosynthesis protein [Kiloniellales bacterium]
MTQVSADSDLIAAPKAPVSLFRYFLTNGSTAAVIKLTAVILSYLFLILLARSVDEAEYGRYGFAISLTVFLGIVANCGQSTALLRFWSQFQAKLDPARAKGALVRSYVTVLLGTGAIFCLAFSTLFLAKLAKPELDIGYLYAAAFLTIPAALSAFQSAAMRALGYVARAMLPTEIFHRGFMVIVLLYLIGSSLRLSAELVLWISGALWLILLIPQAIKILREAQRQAPGVEAELDIPGWRSVSLGLWGLGVLGILSQSSDVVVLGLYYGPEETGTYFVALKVATMFIIFFATTNVLTAPMISRAYHAGDRHEVQEICRTICALLFLPAGFGLLVVFFAGDLILGLFGSGFAEGHVILAVLSAGFAIQILSGPATVLLTMTGHETKHLKILGITRVAMVGAQVLLIPVLGPLGAAIGSALGQVALAMWIRGFAIRHLAIDPTVLCLLKARRRVVVQTR